MANPNFVEKGWANDDIAVDKSTKATPSSKSGVKEKGDIFGLKGNKDPGGNMEMKYGTADWKMPGGFQPQPRDRTWGMRQAQGVPFELGLDSKTEGVEGPEDTYIGRGSVGKSKQPTGRDVQ